MLIGLTPVIVAFFLYCLAHQEMIRNRTYYYFTLACIVGIVIFETLFYFLNDTYGKGFCAIMLGVFHVGALLLTMGYVGGLSMRQIGREVATAAEGFRTGGEAKKPVIVPLTGQAAPPRREPANTPRTDVVITDAEEKPRIVIELPKRNDDDKPSIPLA